MVGKYKKATKSLQIPVSTHNMKASIEERYDVDYGYPTRRVGEGVLA